MRSLLALASILHAEPEQVLPALVEVLADDGGRAFRRRGDELERRLPVSGVEQWRVLVDEEGSRVECEIVASTASSALAGVLARRHLRGMPERFRAVVTTVADSVEKR